MEPSLQDASSNESSNPENEMNGNGVTNGERHYSVASQKLPAYDGIRKIMRNFTPSWFAVTMGTGMVSILLHNLLYGGDWI